MSLDVWPLIDAERLDLADLLDSLAADEWDHRSLCEAWNVRDVVGHLLWVPSVKLASFLPKLVAARLNVDRAIDHIARSAGQRPIDDLRADYRRLVGDRRLPQRTVASGVLADMIVHHQDIRRALQRPRTVPAERISVALAAYAPQAGSGSEVCNCALTMSPGPTGRGRW